MSETLVFVDILVRQIDAAGKRSLAVNDQKLAVIAVIETGRQNRDIGVERVRADTHFLQLFRITHRQARDAAKIVIHDAHIDACRRLFPQKFQNGGPHLSGGDDEKLDKNIVLRFLQFLQHCGIAAFAGWEIFRVRIVVDGVAGGRKQVARVVERRRPGGG